jgi:hypothetical protein
LSDEDALSNLAAGGDPRGQQFSRRRPRLK